MQHAAGGCPGFSLWPVSARADALETGGDFREATGEPASSDGELSDETGSQEESAGKDGDLDAENSDAAGTVGEEEITAVEEQVDFSEEIVVTGTAETEEADGADASGTGVDGGWTLYGSQADVDMTAMAVYALAPYYAGNAEVRSAVDAGLAFLRNGISADGDLESDGDYNCESTAQTIVAFAAMGIDPSSVTSPESGKSLLDGLAQYYNTDTGGFRHTLEDAASNSMATDQALYAIAAYRYCQKGLSIWDFKSPSDTSSYRISAGSTVYTAEASADAVLKVGAGVKEIRIDNIPVGNYDAAEVRAGETVFSTAGRTADGSFPVEGTIPVADGTVLQITVYRQNGTEENWTLTVQTDTAAEARAVIRQIDSLPDAADLTLEDADAVKTARTAFEALGEEEKEQVTNIGRLEELEARLEELETAQEEEREKERRELQKKIEAIQTPVRISDRNQVNQYLQKLDELGDWPEKERLKALLDEYLAEIEKRQALVDELDADIWEQIDPLRIDQGDEAGVQALMARYSTLRVEEQEMLSNRQSLLEAAEVIQSLREGIIPARVFQNLRSTGEEGVPKVMK